MQGPCESDEDNESDEHDEQYEAYPNDFLSYQGTDLDTDLGSVYTLEFEAGSIKAAEEDGQDSEGEDFPMQSNRDSEIAVGPLPTPDIVSGPIEFTNNALLPTVVDIVSQATFRAQRSSADDAVSVGAVATTPVFVPTFWKKGERESFDGDFAQLERISPVSTTPGFANSNEIQAGEISTTPHEPDSPLTAKVCYEG